MLLKGLQLGGEKIKEKSAYSCPSGCTLGLVEASEGGKTRQFLQEKSPKKDLTKSSESEVGIQAEDMSKIAALGIELF